jgi:hypothetical protein
MEVKDYLKDYFSVYSELINTGMKTVSAILAIDQESNKAIELPPILLFRHILELADGLSELYSKECVLASIPISRTLIEAFFQLDYMLSSKDKFENKSYAYLYAVQKKRLLQYERFLQEASKGFSQRLKKDKYLKGKFEMEADEVEEFKKHIALYKSNISQETFSIFREKEFKENDYWYKLLLNSNKIEVITEHLEKQALYEFYYRKLSRFLHANDIIDYYVVSRDEYRHIKALRQYPHDVNELIETNLYFLASSIRVFLSFFIDKYPDITVYKDEVTRSYNKLKSMVVKINIED